MSRFIRVKRLADGEVVHTVDLSHRTLRQAFRLFQAYLAQMNRGEFDAELVSQMKEAA